MLLTMMLLKTLRNNRQFHRGLEKEKIIQSVTSNFKLNCYCQPLHAFRWTEEV